MNNGLSRCKRDALPTELTAPLTILHQNSSGSILSLHNRQFLLYQITCEQKEKVECQVCRDRVEVVVSSG